MRTVFIGVDPRQSVGYNVLQWSIHRYASKPVSVIPLQLRQLPIKRRGLTEFTYSRFLVPHLMGYDGVAIFMDADIVVKGDIHELFDQADRRYSVQVNVDQPKFEWPSVMMFNCHKCVQLQPEWIDDEANNPYNLSSWGDVGTFTPEWNHCVGYKEPRDDAKLYHYTQGLPCWPETQGLPEDKAWNEEAEEVMKTVSWVELMGKSVHAKPVMQRFLARYGINVG